MRKSKLEYKNLNELVEKGFENLYEDEHFIYMVKKTKKKFVYKYHLISKKVNHSVWVEPDTLTVEKFENNYKSYINLKDDPFESSWVDSSLYVVSWMEKLLLILGVTESKLQEIKLKYQ